LQESGQQTVKKNKSNSKLDAMIEELKTFKDTSITIMSSKIEAPKQNEKHSRY
jgi:hypothetical protein